MEIDPLSPRKFSATLRVDNPNEARRRFRGNVMPSFPQETTEPHTPS